MDILAEFLPVAQSLIDDTFPTPIVYRHLADAVYDPTTGEFDKTAMDHAINAGVLGLARSEEGGPLETRTVRLWVHHGEGGLPFEPTTGDEVLYDGSTWRVVNVDPTYASTGLIASKLTCEHQGA